MLALYWRLTQNLRQHLAVKIVAGYVVITYCVMLILYLGVWCRPFHDYWQVPTSNVQCTTALNHLILNLVFNLTSDLMILAIPLPLLLKQHLEWKRKILMAFPFMLGFFSAVCAILSKVSSFRNPFSTQWFYWYCREASTIMIVSNMPYSWALLRRLFKLRSLVGDSSHDDIQDGNVQRLEGQALSRARTLDFTTKSSRKRSWFWSKPPPEQGVTTGSQNEMVSRVKSHPHARESKMESSDATGSDNSVAGSSKKPAIDPVDKLYNLDEDTLIESDPMQRGYDG
jgi:hypothetical protein